MNLLLGQPPVTIKEAPLKEIDIAKVHKYVTSDKKLKAVSDVIINEPDKLERKKLKATTLPYVLPFKYSKLVRAQKYFESAELMAFEADDIEDVDAVFSRIIKDNRILFAYRSVSGNGFKMFVKLDSEVTDKYYLRLYNVLRLMFNKSFDIILDPSSKDLARVQYLSYDSKAYFNAKAKAINASEIIEHLKIYDQSPIDKKTTVDFDYDTNEIEKAIKYIRKNGYLEMKDEQLWWELSMSIASLGEAGRPFFVMLSADNPNYPEDTFAHLNKRYDKFLEAWGNYHDEDRILNMNAFFNKIEKVFKYKAPRQNTAGKKSLEFMLSDKFVTKFKDKLLYDHSKSGKARTYGWYIWNGTHFELSKKGEISDYYIKFIEEEKQLAIEAAARRKSEAENIGLEMDKSVKNKPTKEELDAEADILSLANVSRAESRRLRDLTLTWAGEREGLGVLPDELDKDPELFNTLTGVVNLRTQKLLPHAPEFKITKIAPVVIQQNAKCHNWENFIMKISFNNVEIAKYIQEAVGYSLTGHTSEQCLFFLYGIGANGKSTFLEGLKLIFGDYQIHANYETFTNISRDGSSHSEDVVRLKGSRLVISSEINANKSLNESVIKQMTSGDTVTARDLHSSSIEFKPTFKIWIAGNHKPKIQNFDHGIKRRIFIIPFEYTFKPEEIRPQHEILEEFKAERAGIFNWALEGAQRWFNNKKLEVPQVVKDVTFKYFLENNVIEQFITECCLVTDKDDYKTFTYAEESKALYQAYLDYIITMNEERVGRNNFYNRLEELGYKRETRSDQSIIFRGIKLKKNSNKSVNKTEDLPV